jgi:hypothetical protein
LAENSTTFSADGPLRKSFQTINVVGAQLMSSTEKITDPTMKNSEITPPDEIFGDCSALAQDLSPEIFPIQSPENIAKATEGHDWAVLVQKFEENKARCRELDGRLDDSIALFEEGVRQIKDVLAKIPPETIIEDRIVKLAEQFFEECKSMSVSIAKIGLKDAQSLRQMSEAFAHQASQSNHPEKKRRYLERSESIAKAAALVEQIAYQTIERLSEHDEEDAKIAASRGKDFNN